MRYFITGLLLGIALGFAPWLMPDHSFKLYPQWQGGISGASSIEHSPYAPDSNVLIGPVEIENGYYMFKENGKPAASPGTDDHLVSPSGDGKYYVQYGKLSTEISYCNYRGEPFWAMSTGKYPHLSYGGKLILLVTADNSSISLVDYNGNSTGAGTISGRFCTTIGFSRPGNAASLGFMEGSYYFLNNTGEIVHKGSTPENSLVKTTGISGNARYGAVHAGLPGKGGDTLFLHDIADEDSYMVSLKAESLARASMTINNNGTGAFLGMSHVYLVNIKRETHDAIEIPERREGHSSIQYSDSLYMISYTEKNGTSRFYIFHENGNVIFTRTYPDEPFLDVMVRGQSILLRGSDTLYCYSYQI